MSEQSAFDRKIIEGTTADAGRSILEELHLPPQVISFIRKNKKNLQIAGICLVVLLLAWTFYDHYSETRRDKAAALLASAMKNEEVANRSQLLDKVQSEYGGTAAALWSKVELAHLDYQAGNFPEAVSKYEDVLQQLEADNPLVPLVKYSLAQAFEAQQSFEQALSRYQELARMNGFAKAAYPAIGRIYETINEPAKAQEAYEQYLALLSDDSQTGQLSPTRAIIEERLATLKGAGAAGAEQKK